MAKNEWRIRYSAANLDIITAYKIKAHLDFNEEESDLEIVVEDVPAFEKVIEEIRTFDLNAWMKGEL